MLIHYSLNPYPFAQNITKKHSLSGRAGVLEAKSQLDPSGDPQRGFAAALDGPVLAIGLVTSFFEATLFAFVLEWTPCLKAAAEMEGVPSSFLRSSREQQC